MEMCRWLTEMGLDDSAFMNQYQMNYSDDLTSGLLADVYGQDIQETYSSDSFSYCPNIHPSPWELDATQTCFERSTDQLKATTHSCDFQFSTTHQYSYGTTSDGAKEANISSAKKNVNRNQNYVPKSGQGNKRARTRAPSTVQDHVVAERKRREKLSVQFIALSVVVPGLKKMDKCTVLGDAIEYLKELQERVKRLDEQKAKMTIKSVVIAKKFHISSNENSSSTDDPSSDFSHEPLPEIRAKVLDKDVLIRIHCKQQKGVMAKVLSEIEKLNLSVQDSSMMPSGTSTLNIVVVAQMGHGFDIKVADLMNTLHSAFCLL
ncbi:hypothetical protein ACHQM5_005670 [Ranunculus cassubicifolius]